MSGSAPAFSGKDRRSFRRRTKGDSEPCRFIALFQQRQQVPEPESDASFRRPVIGLGDMQEDGGTEAGPDRIVVVTEFDDNIVNVVLTP